MIINAWPLVQNIILDNLVYKLIVHVALLQTLLVSRQILAKLHQQLKGDLNLIWRRLLRIQLLNLCLQHLYETWSDWLEYAYSAEQGDLVFAHGFMLVKPSF